ncbi:Xaa-Pro aminopeptidase [Parvibium lacunae]|uniref:Xaa-Pro aminopeptidase n=2 Tax=Parvibium lacunae TaxID=1888893 RepID=A0A368L5L0_9BURK|nr:Xaa-Pro aminopeptidase [Parvibium lacunae]RCS58702.1 Xaa-Pro aminopeptidase [Parvibium lacunae]
MNPTPPITRYAERRERLRQLMLAQTQGKPAVAIIFTAPEVMRNRDADYPYRHDSYFYYLSGFTEPQACLVIRTHAPDGQQHHLFCRAKNEEREIWDGYRFGPDQAQQSFGLDQAHTIETLDQQLPGWLANQQAVFYALGSDIDLDQRVQGWLDQVRQQSRAGVSAPHTLFDVRTLLDEMRLFKDADEIALMQRAADISVAAHRRAMELTRPGLFEYQIEASLLHTFRYHGASAPAYGSIVASGAHACVLHYRNNDACLQAGDLLLIDAGCEFGSYAADITRTFPINGRFSPAQRELYEIVLAAQSAAIAATYPGQPFNAPHDAALEVLISGLLSLGLLQGTVPEILANGAYRQFYMHRTSHWLGMDVHDCGEYRAAATDDQSERPWRALAPGMVLTIEPGLYVRPHPNVPERYWNIGIRIEDDVLVTATGCDVMTAAAPKTVADIESLMQAASTAAALP